RSKKNEGSRSPDDVHGTLDHQIPTMQRRPLQRDDRKSLKHFDFSSQTHEFTNRGQSLDLNRRIRQGRKHFLSPLLILRWKTNEDNVDSLADLSVKIGITAEDWDALDSVSTFSKVSTEKPSDPHAKFRMPSNRIRCTATKPASADNKGLS